MHQHISLVTLDLLSEAAEDFPSSILGFPNPAPPVFAAPALLQVKPHEIAVLSVSQRWDMKKL